jgi:hypothetical protein
MCDKNLSLDNPKTSFKIETWDKDIMDMYIHAGDMALALFEINEEIRRLVRGKKPVPQGEDPIEFLQSEVIDIIDNYNLWPVIGVV